MNPQPQPPKTVAYEFLNKHEKKALSQKAALYYEHGKRVRRFRCPKCRTDRVDDLVMLRGGFGECRCCGARILVNINQKDKFVLADQEEES